MPVESEEAYSAAMADRKRLNELKEKRYGGEPGYLTEHGVGLAETLTTMGTNFAAALPATDEGIAAASRQDTSDAYAPAFKETQEFFTYEPRSFMGKEFVGNVGEFFQEYVEEPIQEYLVDPNIKEGNPLMATIGHVAAEALVLLIPIKGGQMIAKKFGQGLGNKGSEKLVDLDGAPAVTKGEPAKGSTAKAKEGEFIKKGEGEGGAESPDVRFDFGDGANRIEAKRTYKAATVEGRLKHKPSEMAEGAAVEGEWIPGEGYAPPPVLYTGKAGNIYEGVRTEKRISQGKVIDVPLMKPKPLSPPAKIVAQQRLIELRNKKAGKPPETVPIPMYSPWANKQSYLDYIAKQERTATAEKYKELELSEGELGDNLVLEFIDTDIITSKAEKPGTYKTWTKKEKALYDAGNWEAFSRARGYTESEIKAHRRHMELARILDKKYGDGYAQSLTYGIKTRILEPAKKAPKKKAVTKRRRKPAKTLDVFQRQKVKENYAEMDRSILQAIEGSKTFKEVGIKSLADMKEKYTAKDLQEKIGYVEIRMPDGGRYKVLNLAERLQDLRTQIVRQKIFNPPVPKPQTRTTGETSRPSKTMMEFMDAKEYSNAALYGELTGKELRFGIMKDANGVYADPMPFSHTQAIKIEGIDLFAGRMSGGQWSVIEPKSGRNIGQNATSKPQAIANAKDSLKSFKASAKATGSKKTLRDVIKRSVAATTEAVTAKHGESKAGVQERLKNVFTNQTKSTFTGMGKKQTGAVKVDVFAEGAETLASGFKAAAKGAAHLGEVTAKTFFYKPVQNIRDIGTPTARKLADLIFAYEFSTKPVAPDLIQRTMQARGMFTHKMNVITESLRGRVGQIPKGVNDAIIFGLRTKKVPERLRKKTAEIRDVLNEVREHAKAAGVDIGYIANYFPRVYDTVKIALHEEKFLGFLQKKGFTLDQAKQTFRNIVENEGMPEMAYTHNRFDPKSNFTHWSSQIFHANKNKHAERARQLDIPDVELAQWLVNDLDAVLTSYIRKVTQRAEFVRTFGRGEEKLNGFVAQIINEAGRSEASRVVGDVYGLADALQGTYKPIQSAKMATLNSTVAAYETVTHLGLVSLASIPETAAPGMMWGFSPKAYAKGLGYTLRESLAAVDRVVTGKRHIPHSATEQHLAMMGNVIKSHAESMQAARFTNVQRGVTNKFMKATGLEHLTNMQRVIAYETLQGIVKRNAQYLSKNTKGKKAEVYARELTELGLNPKEMAAWVREGMPDAVVPDKVAYAIQRGVTWTITHPNAATKPLWMSNPHWTLVSQFKAFTAVFSNTFMKRVLIDLGRKNLTTKKANTLVFMASAVGIAFYVQLLRELLSGREQNKPTMHRVVDAIDRTAMIGDFTYLYQVMSPYRFHNSTMQAMAGLFGPAMGDVAKLADATMFTKSKSRRAKKLATLVPIMNITEPGREVVEDVLK